MIFGLALILTAGIGGTNVLVLLFGTLFFVLGAKWLDLSKFIEVN
jgi:hypothetical protein